MACNINVPYSLRSYYTPNEVAMHNCAEDCWVTLFHQVFDITPLIQENRGPLTIPLIKHSGEDITHWFCSKTRDVKTYMDPERYIEMPYTPYGRFLHVPPPEPVSNWSTVIETPWWKDKTYCIGKLTRKTRLIAIVNVITRNTHKLEVCSEETIREIENRYLAFNSHATSYTWKHLVDDTFVPLDMNLSLEENGILDDSERFEKCDLDETKHVPIIHVYYNDDLTVK